MNEPDVSELVVASCCNKEFFGKKRNGKKFGEFHNWYSPSWQQGISSDRKEIRRILEEFSNTGKRVLTMTWQHLVVSRHQYSML
jgi:hypothetical protein